MWMVWCRAAGEVEPRDVDRLPFAGQRREAVVDGQLRPAVRGEDGGVHPEAGAGEHPVVGQLHHLVPAGVGEGDQVVVGPAIDAQDLAVQLPRTSLTVPPDLWRGGPRSFERPLWIVRAAPALRTPA